MFALILVTVVACLALTLVTYLSLKIHQTQTKLLDSLQKQNQELLNQVRATDIHTLYALNSATGVSDEEQEESGYQTVDNRELELWIRSTAAGMPVGEVELDDFDTEMLRDGL